MIYSQQFYMPNLDFLIECPFGSSLDHMYNNKERCMTDIDKKQCTNNKYITK